MLRCHPESADEGEVRFQDSGYGKIPPCRPLPHDLGCQTIIAVGHFVFIRVLVYSLLPTVYYLPLGIARPDLKLPEWQSIIESANAKYANTPCYALIQDLVAVAVYVYYMQDSTRGGNGPMISFNAEKED